MEDIDPLIKALNNLEQSAGFAQKYGPYFFAVALLVVTPFVCRAVFARSLDGAADPDSRKQAYEDFRFYFRSTVRLGVFCVIAGVAWWLFENYREDGRTQLAVVELRAKLQKIESLQKNMFYTVSGIISAGTKPKDEFLPTLINSDMQVVFARMPQTQAWFFVVTSGKELPSAIDMNLAWSPEVDDPKTPSAILSIPVRLTVSKTFSNYRFSFEDSMGKLQPIK